MRNHKLWKDKNFSGLQLLDRIPRLAVLGVIFGFLFLVLIFRLYRLQIMEGAANQEEFMSSIMKTRRIAGSRGNIYDRNGNLLASNRLSYDITLEDSQNYKSSKERQRSLNGIAYQLISLVKDEDKLNTVLPISVDEQGNYEFTEEGWKLSRFKADFYGKNSVDDLTDAEKSVTADELMKKLCSKEKFLIEDAYTEEEGEQYGLPHTLTPREILQIANIRYGLSLNSYRKYLPYLVASDVSEEAMVEVLEKKLSLPGADIQEGNVRVYYGGESLSSILGYTGPVSAEELEAGNRDGAIYTNQSIIGKGGIEKSMEGQLRGQDGMEQFYTDVVGNRKSDPEITSMPHTGNDVYLTIDKDLQNAVYQMLEQQIAGILLANMEESKRADMPKAADASQIRISSDEVYFALIKNHVIDTGRFQETDASDLEKAVYERFAGKKEQVFQGFSDSFDVSGAGYDSLSGEVKGYYDYLLDTVRKNKILSEKSRAWDQKEQSFRQYLSDCIANGWIDLSQVEASEKYMTLDNSRSLIEEMILDGLRKDSGFDLLIYQAMITEGTLTGEDVEKLLYDQGILSKEDPDYAPLLNGQLNAWQFIRKKIKNLEITPAQLALNPCSGSAVVVRPQDGQVLACVSYPGYDNNRLANQMDTSYYQKLAADLSLPLFNRATSQLTAPGSTFKPVTVIAGLSEGVITTDTSVVCTGVFDKVQPPLRCWKRSGHGTILSSADALKNSCNVYLSEITYRLGTEEDGLFSEGKGLSKLQEYAGLLDLDKKTGIEIGEAEPHVTDQFAIPSSIGQGTHNYTTTQIARYTATLANHGSSYDLSLIYKITDTDDNTVQSFNPTLQNNVSLPGYVWNDVAKGMNELVKTNATLKDLKVNAAGKTGTAEESKTRPNHGLFIGYAPFEDPQIAITVRIANGYSSGNVVGVGKGILNYYFHLEDPADILTGTASGVSNNLRTD
ncbi:penicillin-binding transpeptidase domain-containing protein [Lacrimispora indolis]|uniref:penicillin-binding transpeptidase domain-containing protein n=1 Tax=Lacrimispora indolis TaxID=69825 RepID=UPI00045E6940|nr:penicillin-binding transpeptidase domain-containing protein [Lacrimispora indolis]